ncbi:uncharacterized protein [Leptinotarsa decemlineata]|uniref:uncharacterized protein n=1 Tax=Leptinotarsa decemlineata TaxID=7539 RepID=UPI003D3044D8
MKKSTTDNSNNSEESISPFPTRFVQVSGSDDVRPMCSKDVSAVASPIEIVESTVNTFQSLYTGVSLQGRRLADIGYLLKQIAEISKHPPFDCTFSDMYPIHEYKMGLKTQISFVCKMCIIERTIHLIETRRNFITTNVGQPLLKMK